MGGSGSSDHCTKAVELPTSEIMICGSARSFGVNGNNNKGYINKLSSNGNLLWSKLYHGPVEDGFMSMRFTGDNNLIVVGNSHSSSSNRNISLTKIDTAGNIIWQRKYGGPGDERGVDVVELDNGDFIINGYTESFSSGPRDIIAIPD